PATLQMRSVPLMERLVNATVVRPRRRSTLTSPTDALTSGHAAAGAQTIDCTASPSGTSSRTEYVASGSTRSSQSPAATCASSPSLTLMPPAQKSYTVPAVTPAPATLQMRSTGLPRLV